MTTRSKLTVFYLVILVSSFFQHGSLRPTSSNQRPTTSMTEGNKTREEMQSECGKYFVLGFMHPSHSREQVVGKFIMFITALKNFTTVRVFIPFTSFDKVYNIEKDSVLKVDVPSEVIMANEAKLQRKGVEIQANKDVKVYVFRKSIQSQILDGFPVYPRTSLGREYVATSYGGQGSSLGIVGAYSGTKVRIEISRDVRVTYGHQVYKSGQTLSFSVDKLETVELRSDGDLSGLRVLAEKPVAVFAGTQCDLTKISSNCVVKQLPAVETWGQKFVVYIGESESTFGELVRVASAGKGAVVVTTGNGARTMLGVGGVMDLVVQPRVATIISCIPRCMPTLYRTRLNTGVNKQLASTMTVIPSVTQFLSYYHFYIPENTSASLTITIKCSSTEGLVLNGVPIPNVTASTSSGDWCEGQLVNELRHGINIIYHNQMIPFGAMVTGDNDVYSYDAGRSLAVQKNQDLSRRPTLEARPAIQSSKAVHVGEVFNVQPKHTSTMFKITTIALGVVCGALLCALVIILVRRRTRRHTVKEPEESKESEYMEPKQPNEKDYQTIKRFPSFRGVPRRNTHSYETIRLPFRRGTRPTVGEVFSPGETGQENETSSPGETGQEYETSSPGGTGQEYETCSPCEQEYENVRSRIRDSNPYMAMDQALAGSALAASAVVLSMPGNENDIYLTMKKSLIRTTEPAAAAPDETQIIIL